MIMAINAEMGLGALPFRSLTDFDLEYLNKSFKKHTIENLEDNGFMNFFKTNRPDIPLGKNPALFKQYYDADQFNSIPSMNRNHGINLCHLNIRRLSKNKGNFIAFLSTLKTTFDVIILTEIGDNADYFLNSNLLSDYDYISDFRELPENNKYGGVAILLKKDIGKAIPRHDLKIKKSCSCDKCVFENVWIELQIHNESFIIGGIYRHPNGNAAHFTHDLETTLDKIDRKLNSIVAGDINIDLNKYEEKTTFEYFTTLASHMFLPYILAPTRITDYKVSTLDHIFARLPLNNIENNIYSGNIFAEITDHLPNFISISKSPKPVNKKHRPLIRIFSENNINQFRTSLSEVNWEDLLNVDDTDEAYDIFYNKLLQIYEASFPLKQISRKRAKDKPWITDALKKSINHKNMLYRKKCKKPTQENIQTFITYRNRLSSCLEQAEINYYDEIFSDRQTGIKSFWKTFGQTLNPGKKKKSAHLQKLIIGDEEIRGDQNIADKMNTHFCNVGRNINRKLPNIAGSFTNYLKNQIRHTFFLSPVIEQEISRELSNLNQKKSAGPDNITPKLARQCAEQLKKPLELLYNKSILNATYPSILKLAKVIALYKKKIPFCSI